MTGILIWVRRSTTATILAVMAILLIGVFAVQSSYGLGGLISELVVGQGGVADSRLLIGNAANSEMIVIGMAPVVSTQPVSAQGEQTATLNGRITSMNGLPRATGYFQWGYSASSLTNTTTSFPITVAGDYSTAITGFVQSDRIYYRFLTDADGTAVGNIVDFVVPSGIGGLLLKTLLRILIATGIIITVLLLGSRGGTIAMIMAAILGLIGFVVIDVFLGLIL